jgi:deoxyribodipyrimidine photolyase
MFALRLRLSSLTLSSRQLSRSTKPSQHTIGMVRASRSQTATMASTATKLAAAAVEPVKKAAEPVIDTLQSIATTTETAKRKAETTLVSDGVKKPKITSLSDDPLRQPHHRAQEAEENGIVLRKFYPHEMSNERALAYNNDELPRPIELLEHALRETAKARAAIQTKECVVHWFKWDLRMGDNKALHMASRQAEEHNVPLVALYVLSPQDFEAHLTSPVRVDFLLCTLEVLRDDLAKLDIPLWIEVVEKRRDVHGRILELLGEWKASHFYANMEYEVDELRREARLVRGCLEKGVCMEVVHDTCVVEPGALTSGSGKQYSVYSPWYRSWVAHLHANPGMLDLFDPPHHNLAIARSKYSKLFDCPIPSAPESKSLTEEEKSRFRSMWPAGEHAAYERLQKFAEHKIKAYGDRRNFPADTATSSISVHLAAGTLSARTAIHTAREHNTSKKLDAGVAGIQTWISEVAWRDFYKHVLVHWPYVWYVFFVFVLSSVRFERRCFNPWEWLADDERLWQHEQTLQARVHEYRVGIQRRPLRSLDAGPHWLSHCRRCHETAQPLRVHAQPVPDDRGILPRQGSVDRLAHGRALLHGASDRRRLRLEQWRVGIQCQYGCGPAAVLQDL